MISNHFIVPHFFSYDIPKGAVKTEKIYKIERVYAQIIGLDLLGENKNALVLKLNFPTANMKHIQYKLEYPECEPTYSEYNPHLTLTYSYDKSCDIFDIIESLCGIFISFDKFVEVIDVDY